MSAPSLGPEGVASGAPLAAGGQARGAGELAPNRLVELQEQLRQELRTARQIAEIFDDIEKRVHPRSVYHSYVHYALEEFEDMVFNEFDEASVESVRRVIDASNTNVKLTDFADLQETLARLKRTAEKRGEDDVLELARKLEQMTLAEFLQEWEDIVEKLKEHDHYDVMDELFTIIDYDGRLARVLDEEIKKIAMKKYGMTEDEAERLIECLVEC